MKTAEEWYGEQTQEWYGQPAIDQIKQIQLDAYKAGMTEAAEISSELPLNNLTTHYQAAQNIKCRILSARDNKKEI